MEWRACGDPASSAVHVPDAAGEIILTAVDTPRGSVPLDPYRDARLSVDRLPAVLASLQTAVRDRREAHRRDTLRQLRLAHWEPWAAGALEASEQRDGALAVLVRLESLCADALARGADVLVLGD